MPSFGRLLTPLCKRQCLQLSSAQIRHLPICATPLSEPLDNIESNQPRSGTYSTDVEVTTLNNGLKVATIDNAHVTSKVGLFFNAGSRYETVQNSGISHMLRVGAFLTTSDYSGFHISRTMEENGICLEASSSREHVVYTAECLKNNIDIVVNYLASVTTSPEFRQWELTDSFEKIELDLALAHSNPQIALFENLHRVAYKNGLRNSIYCKPHRTKTFTTDMMLNYVQDKFVGNKMAIVGVGVEHKELVSLCRERFSSVSAGTETIKDKPVYKGGEYQDEQSQSLVHVALATPGACLGDNMYLPLAVLQRVLGVTPFIKWGSNTVSSRLNKAVHEVTNGPFLASTININYSDSGLFGFYAAMQPKDAVKVTRAIVDQFSKASKGSISNDEVQRAKNQVQSSLLMSSESPSVQLEDIGTQVLASGTYMSPEKACEMIDKINLEDVVTAAKKVFGKTPSLSIVGESEELPHIDELLS